ADGAEIDAEFVVEERAVVPGERDGSGGAALVPGAFAGEGDASARAPAGEGGVESGAGAQGGPPGGGIDGALGDPPAESAGGGVGCGGDAQVEARGAGGGGQEDWLVVGGGLDLHGPDDGRGGVEVQVARQAGRRRGCGEGGREQGDDGRTSKLGPTRHVVVNLCRTAFGRQRERRGGEV